jgi:aminoglycoside phosphotransferase (APT) family kinase protein
MDLTELSRLHVDEFQTYDRIIMYAPFGNGHINQTYLMADATGCQYILQKINKRVFKDPVALMRNIQAVTAHQREKASHPRASMSLIPTNDWNFWYVDGEGEYYRMFRYIADSICLDQAETLNDFRESAIAFGIFQRQLSDFPAHTLTETIPHFHDTPNRFKLFKAALAADVMDRAKNVQREIDFALAREDFAGTLISLQASGDLPLRVTHNDTKLNNVLFDRDTRRSLCVIDLDTVMPGLSVNDFGDSIRFGANTANEDERDLSLVRFSRELYDAYVDGYLSSCGDSLTACEREHLRTGAKMMTLECGVRFLTDYLSGDVYFRIARESHNLDRCRTQFKLITEMEAVWESMAVR